jgi:hypothetical protein
LKTYKLNRPFLPPLIIFENSNVLSLSSLLCTCLSASTKEQLAPKKSLTAGSLFFQSKLAKEEEERNRNDRHHRKTKRVNLDMVCSSAFVCVFRCNRNLSGFPQFLPIQTHWHNRETARTQNIEVKKTKHNKKKIVFG